MNFYVLLIYLIISLVFTEGLSYLITNSQLFQLWRDLLTNRGKQLNLIDSYGTNYLEYMVQCHLCTSHQIAIFVSIFQPYIYEFPTNIVVLNIIITSILIGRTSYILFNIYELLNTWLINSSQ